MPLSRHLSGLALETLLGFAFRESYLGLAFSCTADGKSCKCYNHGWKDQAT